jgi:hypothetical protein
MLGCCFGSAKTDVGMNPTAAETSRQKITNKTIQITAVATLGITITIIGILANLEISPFNVLSDPVDILFIVGGASICTIALISVSSYRMRNIGGNAGARDKIFKAIITFFRIGQYAAIVGEYSSMCVAKWTKGMVAVTHGRHMLGLLNPLVGIENSADAMRAISRGVRGVEIVKIKDAATGKEIESEQLIADFSRTEQALSVSASFFKLVDTLAYNATFLCCGPASFAADYFDAGKTAYVIGRQIPLCLLIKDSSGFVTSVLNLPRQKLEFNRRSAAISRRWQAAGADQQSALAKEKAKLTQDYYKGLGRTWLRLFKEGSDSAGGIINVAKLPVPVEASLAVATLSSALALVEIWLDSAPRT